MATSGMPSGRSSHGLTLQRLFAPNDVSHSLHPVPSRSSHPASKRRLAAERIAATHLRAMSGNLAETVGTDQRKRLVWLSLLAMPLLFPVALPGTASAVGFFCLLVAAGLVFRRAVPLPRWVGTMHLHQQAKQLLTATASRVIRVVAWAGRPRLLRLTAPGLRPIHGVMLAAAGLSMMVPVPMISFDNVLPALAIVLIAWGIRLRDGLLLVAGYLATLLAAVSVFVLWWGGAYLVTQLLTGIGGLGQS